MDLGCGKGGDLQKFNFERIANYVGVDISIRGLEDAVVRKVKLAINFPSVFINMSGDLEPEAFEAKLPKHTFYDVVSAQFCIHYFFSSEQTTRNFLANVTGKMTKNGIFIATFPDSNVIMKKLQTGKIVDESHVFDAQKFALFMSKENADKEDYYGIKYGFFLDDGLIGSIIRPQGGNEA